MFTLKTVLKFNNILLRGNLDSSDDHSCSKVRVNVI